MVVVRTEHDIGARVVQRLHQRLHGRVVAVLAAAPARVVPVGQRAALRVGGQVGAQPLLLGAAGGAGHDRAVAVQRDDVPAAQLVGVPALADLTGPRAVVGPVRRAARRLVLVVADGRPHERAQRAPAPVERRRDLRGGRLLVLHVPEDGDHVRVLRLRAGGHGGLLAGGPGAQAAVEGGVERVARDVADRDEDGVAGDDGRRAGGAGVPRGEGGARGAAGGASCGGEGGGEGERGGARGRTAHQQLHVVRPGGQRAGEGERAVPRPSAADAEP